MERRIFNPEHDLCIASEEPNFIPPAAALAFGKQCKWVEKFMVSPQGEERKVLPWGWNRYLRDRLLQEGVPAGELPSDAELDFIKENSRREVAQELLEFFSKNEPDIAGRAVSPSYRIIARSIGEIEEFLQQNEKVVLKAPLSGSGKGVRFVSGELMETDRGWCRRILQLQGSVIVEKRLDVVQEFAMLFEVGEPDSCQGTVVRFRGYSLFYASNGAYKGNLLASNEYIEDQLCKWISLEALQATREMVGKFLEKRLCVRDAEDGVYRGYRGFVGVDQFVFKVERQNGTDTMHEREEYCFNPAVEINLRMTMGLVARNIYDFYRSEFSLGDGTHCFEPIKGIFVRQ